MTLATSNPLLLPWTAAHGLPPFESVRAEHFEPAYEVALAQHLAEVDAIAADANPPSFDNTIAAIDRSGRLLDRIEGLFHNLTSSETSPALQAVEMRMAPRLAAHSSAFFMHRALFARIDALHAQRETLGLTPEQRRVLERFHFDFVRAGAKLAPAAQTRYAQIMSRLAELTTRFGQNVLADESAYRLVLRDEAERAGRRRDDIKVFLGATIVTAPTDALAREKLADYLHHANPEAGLAHFASGTGIDFSRYGLDDPIAPPGSGTHGHGNAMQSAVKAVTASPKTKRQLLADMALGGRYAPIVGSPQRVADELIGWARDTGIDGFNLARTVTPECFEDIVELVVPELQNRGAYKTAYAPGTLRDKLFERGPRLPAHHAGAAFRRR